MRCCLITFLTIQIHLVLVVTGYSQAQLLDQKVTLSFEDIPLESLLDHLRQVYDLKISYSADHIPLNQKVEIDAFNLPLRILLERLCNMTGLSYMIIDSHIVLREKLTAEKISTFQEEAFPEKTDIQDFSPLVKTKRDSKQIETIRPKGDLFVKYEDTTRMILNQVTATSSSLSGTAGKKHGRKGRMGLDVAMGVLASYDYYKYNFIERPNANQKYYPEKNFTIGIVGVMGPNQKFSASLGLLFSTKSYRLDYNYQLLNPDDPFPFPERTKVGLSFAKLPVNFDYQIFKTGRLSLYLSAGLTVEFLTHKDEFTTYLNAEEKSTSYFLEDNNILLWGGTFGIKFWYKVSKPVSIFFTPHFTYYFTPLNEVIMKSNPQILELKTGVTINLKQMN